MRPLGLLPGGRRATSILCLGAHPDDLEIGCAGTVRLLLGGARRVRVTWVVFSGAGARAEEARRSAERLLKGAVGADIAVEGFRDGFFPQQGAEIKEYFEALKGRLRPDIVFTHHLADRHQDHRVLAELTWNTFRDHWILEYEVPKYDGGLETPNLFVPLDSATRRWKTRHLMRAFPSQQGKGWFDEQTFLGLMRLRGVECASPTGHAEGFHSRKGLWSPQA